MEDISKIEGKFDIVFSSLAFHYVKDYDKLTKDIYNLLDDIEDVTDVYHNVDLGE